jgi:hypothetical protein
VHKSPSPLWGGIEGGGHEQREPAKTISRIKRFAQRAGLTSPFRGRMSRSDRRGVVFQPPQGSPSVRVDADISPQVGRSRKWRVRLKVMQHWRQPLPSGGGCRAATGGGSLAASQSHPSLSPKLATSRPQGERLGLRLITPLRPRWHSKPRGPDGSAPHHGHG